MPTTNQTSRAPKRKKRAPESRLISAVFERMVENLALAFDLPRPGGSRVTAPASTSASAAAIAQRAAAKPSAARSVPPRKNPAPFSAFLEPVRIETQRNNVEWPPVGTKTLIVLFELDFVRS